MYPHGAGDESLYRALRDLALTEGALQERLAKAAARLLPLQATDYHPDIDPRVRALLDKLSTAPVQTGAIHATVQGMSDDETKRYIDQIITIAIDAFELTGAAKAQSPN